MLTSPSREQAPATSPLFEIANVMVHLYKDAFGRGPSKAWAQFSGSDTLVVLLAGMMTIAERHLVALGEHARVREQRLFLQLALEDKKRSEVQRILRRRTLACISGTDPDRDLAAEVFLLEPHPAGNVRHACAEVLRKDPFDSAVELDDLPEETRAYALRYRRAGSATGLADGRRIVTGSDERESRSPMEPRPIGPLIPFRAGLAILVQAK